MKSECVELNELVSAFADGELDGAEEERVEAHLAACEDCRAFVEACRRIDGALGEGLRAPGVAPLRWEAMRAQLGAAGRRPARRARIRPVKALAFVASVAAACLLVVAGLVPGPGGGGHRPDREYLSAESVSSDSYFMPISAPEGGLNMVVVAEVEEEDAEKKPESGEER